MFEGIYGHDVQKEMLRSAINEDKLSHAYLFYGPDGIGKKKLAIEFAKQILKVDDLDTCVDYKYIEKKDDKKDIIVDQIRENIISDVIEKPISSQKKVYIINDAHLLNDMAQNALLKTLEEPPKYIVIIMISSNLSTILPTVLSRLSKVEFSYLSKNDIDNYVKENKIEISAKILEFCQGSIGLLSDIVSKKYESEFLKIDGLVKDIVKKEKAKVLLDASNIDFSLNICLDYFEFCMFDEKLYLSSLEVKSAKNRLKNNGNYDIVIDNMLLRCIERV